MAYECRIETDSITKYGERLTTFVCTFPRFILAEVNTHKMISKSSASSRAIPVEKQLKKVLDDPFSPIYWGKNQKGMQAAQELDPADADEAKEVWLCARMDAMNSVNKLLDLDVHKQTANRLLEPFMWHTAILTGTDWSNFFNLRDNEMAQPEFREIAHWMRVLYNESKPKLLNDGEWHLPFTELAERECSDAVDVSVGRCARVSYQTHEGKRDHEADVSLARSLLSNGHMTPFEHVARPMTSVERNLFRKAKRQYHEQSKSWENIGESYYCGNLNGWIQKRKMIHGESDMLGVKR